MAAPQEIIQEIFTVIEGGTDLGEAAKIIQFPSDNGANTFSAVQQTYKGTNGSGLNYWVAAFVSGARAISAGAALLAMEVPAAGVAIAPALGIAIGAISYNIAPELWDSIAEKLIAAGETINGKLVAYMNTEGNVTFSEVAVEIYKDAFLEAGIFDEQDDIPEYDHDEELYKVNSCMTFDEVLSYGTNRTGENYIFSSSARNKLKTLLEPYSNWYVIGLLSRDSSASIYFGWGHHFQLLNPLEYINLGSYISDTISHVIRLYSRFNGVYHEIEDVQLLINARPSEYTGPFVGEYSYEHTFFISGINATLVQNPALQKGAIYPNEDPFPLRYPGFLPWEFPLTPGGQLPNRYPFEYPSVLPKEEPYQDPAQHPGENTEENPDKVIETITDPAKDPQNKPAADPDADADTDIPADAEDLPGDDIDDEPANPIDPDPDPTPTPIIPVTPLPNTVGSSRLFTVYNPDQIELGQLGAYLWDMDLIDMLRRIWQNPLDGIISLSQVFCTPVTGSPHNIILGFLDSGVSANIVASQFATIDCGVVSIPEQKQNATDYSPYTSMELYLPFIGITEIDTNEFMGGSIGVKYKIDVYTGTCLAEVRMIRAKDVPHGGVVYTFNGNCSQQVPLTSGDSRELIATLLSAAGIGIGIATGGAIGVVEATSGMAGAIRREMLHVSHSGNLSANAGILGNKKPYVIINRQNPYNANGYNKLYGYPSNKTVYLGNCSGYTRVKAGRLQSLATQAEKDEIMEFLTDGVIM